MASLILTFQMHLLCALFLIGALASPSMAAPEPMGEMELGGVEAGTGVNLHFDNLVVETQGGTLRFVPDDALEPNNYVELTGMSGKRTLNGDLSILVGTYTAPQRSWFIQDTAKVRTGSAGLFNLNYSFVHARKPYQIQKPSGYKTNAEARGIDAVTLGMVGIGLDPFSSQESSMGLLFSADGYRNPVTGTVMTTPLWVDSGTIAVSGMNTYGQQVTLYPINTIPGYVSGEGLALEIRSKSSIGEIKLTAPDGTINALIKGVHMRESFSQDVHSQYGKWGDMNGGYFASDAPSEYFQSTYDPDGFYGKTWDPKDTPINPGLISAPFAGGPGYYNMYDGYMMNGNINQIDFDDSIGGKRLVYDHGQLTANDTITSGSFDSGLDSDYQVRSQDAANAIAIEERPMTIQVKTGRTYKRFDAGANALVDTYDGRSYIAINWPRHGAVRVEEIQGYLSKDEAPYNAFGTSMGSMILDGMRAKKTYIEFPGRNEQYLITEQNMNPNGTRHNYVYDAGRLPDAMNSNGLPPWGQPDWDPIGRGQIDFLSKLGNPSNPTGGRWELYDIQKTVGGVTYDFWHLYEPPYPGSAARWTPDH